MIEFHTDLKIDGKKIIDWIGRNSPGEIMNFWAKGSSENFSKESEILLHIAALILRIRISILSIQSNVYQQTFYAQEEQIKIFYNDGLDCHYQSLNLMETKAKYFIIYKKEDKVLLSNFLSEAFYSIMISIKQKKVENNGYNRSPTYSSIRKEEQNLLPNTNLSKPFQIEEQKEIKQNEYKNKFLSSSYVEPRNQEIHSPPQGSVREFKNGAHGFSDDYIKPPNNEYEINKFDYLTRLIIQNIEKKNIIDRKSVV